MARNRRTYNPCDDCQYRFTLHNQDHPMCKICEFKDSLNEVEALKDTNEHLAVMLSEAKTEVDKWIDRSRDWHEVAEAKSKMTREIFEEIDKITLHYLIDDDYSSGEMIYDIDELKKKYTGETK